MRQSQRQGQTRDPSRRTMVEVPAGVDVDLPLPVALARACEVTPSLDQELVPLNEAHNRILARPLASRVDDPPFDNSAMDGWALRYEDTNDASERTPAPLRIIGESRAAHEPNLPSVTSGTAVRIMTGAQVPPGADAILPIEHSRIEGDEVHVLAPGRPGFIRRRAENLAIGMIGLEQGAWLTPARVGLCATMGHAEVPVLRRLRVTILSTGDELKPPGHDLLPGEIHESNSYGLVGLVRRMGHEAIVKDAVHDTAHALRTALNEASADSDLILTSGGVSMGEYDLVRDLMFEHGSTRFWKILLRPGGPPIFGTWNDVPLFGLPGNPVSSHVVFRVLVAPWMRSVTGADGPIEPMVRVRLVEAVKVAKNRLTLRRIQVEHTEEGLLAHAPTHQGSGNLNSLVLGDALTWIEPGTIADAGSWVDAILL